MRVDKPRQVTEFRSVGNASVLVRYQGDEGTCLAKLPKTGTAGAETMTLRESFQHQLAKALSVPCAEPAIAQIEVGAIPAEIRAAAVVNGDNFYSAASYVDDLEKNRREATLDDLDEAVADRIVAFEALISQVDTDRLRDRRFRDVLRSRSRGWLVFDFEGLSMRIRAGSLARNDGGRRDEPQDFLFRALAARRLRVARCVNEIPSVVDAVSTLFATLPFSGAAAFATEMRANLQDRVGYLQAYLADAR